VATLRGNEAWQLAVMRAHGREEEAQASLDALNKIQRAFGFPDYEMPEAASVGLPDLVIYPSGLPDREPLTECHGDPLLKRRAA
jgi:hypothetical protein